MLSPREREQVRDFKVDFTVRELQQFIKECVFDALDTYEEKRNIQHEQGKPLLTINDIALRFKVTKATVHNWKKQGIIAGTKRGKNRYFTEEEARSALKYGY